ncbi:MAG: hypothetical protein NTW28_11470 [Candidatus Solibacter sp.]|nr:hypothetical protein [Candidatus Solibacter sp.]
MITLDTAANQPWKWQQPEAFQRFHRMTVDEREGATLRFEKNWGGTLASAVCAQGSWTFKRSGFLSPRITVRAPGSDTDLATFSPKWTGGGELWFSSGRRYVLKSLSFWGGDWAFEDERGLPVLTLHGPHGFLKNSGEIRVNTAAADPATLPILAILIWYVRLLMNEDAATSTACNVAVG